MYGLTEQDRRIRDTAREFVESLMPHEVEAELAGRCPAEGDHRRASGPGNRIGSVRDQHADVGRRPGLHAPCSRCWCRNSAAG